MTRLVFVDRSDFLGLIIFDQASDSLPKRSMESSQ